MSDNDSDGDGGAAGAGAAAAAGLAVGASDPAYMVFYKNTSFGDAYAVAAAFATSQSIPLNQIQSVPEPSERYRATNEPSPVEPPIRTV